MASSLATATPASLEPGLIAELRALSPARRLMLARDMNWMADWLAMAAIVRRRTDADQRALGLELALQRLTPEQCRHGSSLLQELDLVLRPVDPLALALRMGAVLDALAIPYLIVGSLASVAHGEYRLTRDLDIMLDLAPTDVGRFVDGLWVAATFLAGDIAEALGRLSELGADQGQRASFWAYDRVSGFPIDLCLSAGRPFEVAQLKRAQTISIPVLPGGTLRVASPEDTALAKLQWYAQAPSDLQWRDVQALLHVQDRLLDRAYLRRWAADLGIEALLTLALKGQQPR